MSGYIYEFFGYRADDLSEIATTAPFRQLCPFINSPCSKIMSRDGTISGVCSIRQKTMGSPSVICCPNRIYSDDYRILHLIAQKAFGVNLNMYSGRAAVERAEIDGGAIAVFGHGWGGELRLPKRTGKGSYFVDWVLARLDAHGNLVDFTAIEIQTIDTTGNYRSARQALIDTRQIIPDTVGLNWENVSKRIIPQIIYKGQVLQREDLCSKGLFFVCPKAVYDRILERLGGVDRIPTFPAQPASINFIAYDYIDNEGTVDGCTIPLGIVDEHRTTVYKVQEAFSSIDLPEGNVYGNAIKKSLYE